MEAIEKTIGKDPARWGLIGALIGAIGASVCCLGPLLLLALGISGAWISNLAAFDAYRPIFSLITLGFLGFAFYKVYHKPKEAECAEGSYCANPKADKRNKIILWIVTAFIMVLLVFPYLVPVLFAQTTSQAKVETKQVILAVTNMSCSACPITVKKSLNKLDGVKEVKVTLNPPEAIVTYSPSKVAISELTEATKNAGFPSKVKKGE